MREDAARGLWDRYVPRCSTWLTSSRSQAVLRREDEDDVLQSMYASFCIRQQRGNFDLSGRDDLWKLLVTVTLRKARNAARRHRRDARDYRREGDADGGDSTGRGWDIEPCDVSEPTLADAAAFNDELERRLRALGDPVLRRIALCKLEGYTNKEIARELDNCTERTIERKLAHPQQVGDLTRRTSDDRRVRLPGTTCLWAIGNGPFRGGAGMSGEPDDDSSLIDLVADRFERAWLAGEAPRIEEYLDGVDGTRRRGSSMSCSTSNENCERGRFAAEPGRVSPPFPRPDRGDRPDPAGPADPLATEVYVRGRADHGR